MRRHTIVFGGNGWFPRLGGVVVASLVHTVQQHPEGWVHLALAGTFDENNGLHEQALPGNCTWCLVDMAAVKRWNSTGVRDWMQWLQTHTKLGVVFVLVDVSVSTVAQLNLTGRFQNLTEVYSICLPYFCEACNLEHSTVMSVSELQAQERRSAPVLSCSACGENLEFDDIEEAFFHFVPTQRNPLDEEMISLRLYLARQGDMGQVPQTVDSERIPYPTMTPDPVPASVDESQSAPSKLDTIYYLSVGALMFLLGLIVYHVVNL